MSAPFFHVTIEGEDVSDFLERLDVEESDAQADMATLTFGNRSLVLSDILQEGLTVEIDLGREDVHALIFRGILTEIRPDFPGQGLPRVEVQAMDSLIQLGLRPRTRSWWNITVGQMVRDIAQANGLEVGTIEPVEDALIDNLRPYTQIEETDLAFLFRLAQDYDSKLYVEHGESGDTLNFISTRKLIGAEPIEESLVFNANLENFSTAFNSLATNPIKRLVTTDPLTGDRVEIQETLAQTQDAVWIPDAERLARVGEGADRLARLVAKAAPKREQLSQFWQVPPRAVGAASRPASQRGGTFGDWARRIGETATGRAVGSVWLRPRRRVVVEGYGGRWSGNWYLAEVKHQIDVSQRSYICSFTCTR
jgi:hypothetical protein